MSRHEIVEEGRTWVFGWDQPLMSFFLQRHDSHVAEDENPVVWLGATSDTKMYEIQDLVDTAAKLGLKIDHEMRVVLYGERDEGI